MITLSHHGGFVDPQDSYVDAPVWLGYGLAVLKTAPWWVWLAVLGMLLFLGGLYWFNEKLGGYRR